MTPDPGGRKLLSRPERRRSILAAAARAFARKGFAATSMEDISAEAGVTKMILYQHFASKHELYEAVLDRTRARLREVSGPRYLGPEGLRALVTVGREDPDGFLLLFRHAAREPEFASYAEEFTTRMFTIAEDYLRGQVLDETRRRWVARLSVRMAFESVIAWLEVGDPAEDERVAGRLFQVLTCLTHVA